MAGTSAQVGRGEEWGRIGRMEHNVAIDQTDLFGPSRRFEEKGQSSNPTSAGGINRALKGKGQATKHYSGSKQGKDGGPARHGSPSKGKSSPARKHRTI